MTERPHPVARPLVDVFDRVNLDATGDLSISVSGITHDSREVVPGDIYAALPGFTVHGADFVTQAVEAGAVAVLTDREGAGRIGAPAFPVLVSDHPRAAVGPIAAWVFGDPADDVMVIGITGTNGKTTTAFLVDAGLRAAGHATGLIGTLGTFVGERRIPTSRTTPEASDVHALLAVMRERGVTAVTMEVSSHALALHRVGGLTVDVAGFTNLSRDHLDFHGTMESYFKSKAELFTPPRSRRGVVCIDGDWGRQLVDTASIPVSTTATEGALADWQLLSTQRLPSGLTQLDIREPNGSVVALTSALLGTFNYANLVMAFALLRSAGIPAVLAVKGLSEAVGVPGRMERVPSGHSGIDVVVDYAHSPDAIDRVIVTAREFARGRVIVVVGAGGDRDRDKRPEMGRSASAADLVIVTDDNPRSEDPADIRRSVRSGVSADVDVREEGDRRRAIELALHTAKAGDCVLIVGKGHETGQDFGVHRDDFDDRVVAAETLVQMGWSL